MKKEKTTYFSAWHDWSHFCFGADWCYNSKSCWDVSFYFAFWGFGWTHVDRAEMERVMKSIKTVTPKKKKKRK